VSNLTKPHGEKKSPHPQLKANDLLDLLATKQPQSWKSLTATLNARAPHEIKKLRQVLKGLIRQGQIREEQGHLYHLVAADPRKSSSAQAADSAEPVQGTVQGFGGRLSVDGLPIARVGGKEAIAVRPGDLVLYRRGGEPPEPVAEIQALQERSTQPGVGILNLRGRWPVVDPLARSFTGRMRVEGGVQEATHGDAVRVEILDQDRHGLVGRVLDVLPNASVVEQAIDATLESLDIPREWPEAVVKAAGRLPKSVQGAQHADRQDLTEIPLVTIDGATAKDFDDAVYAKALDKQGGSKKGWRLIVAIADVAHYVKPRSALDVEAAERTTSVYLPGHVVPMLPEAVSNELCSLKPEVHRLALVCDMQVTNTGAVRSYTFYDALIRSHARLTYEQVQAHLDHGAALPCPVPAVAAVAASIAALADVHAAFRKAKDARGGLDFDSREGVIDIEQGHVTGVQEVARLQAHQIIEEAMINANVCAAAFIEANDSRSLYRLHEAPDALKLETLRQDLMAIGLQIPDGVPSSQTYQKLLRDIAEKERGWLYQQLVLRSMKQAVYGPTNAGHFGLGLERYMHFTSPIRRYPDLLVHRAIKSILQQRANRQGWVPTGEQLLELGERCSSNERRAESAGWTVEAWLKCDLVKRHVGEVLSGTIGGVTEFGLFVDLDGFYVQGLLHISDLGADYFRYDPRRQCLVGDRSGRRFTLGEPLAVSVTNVEPPQGKIELQLAPNHAGSRPKSSKDQASKGRVSKNQASKDQSAKKATAQATGTKREKTTGAAKASKQTAGDRVSAAKARAKNQSGEAQTQKQSQAKSKVKTQTKTTTKSKKKQTTPKGVKRRQRNNNG
jgi:ribonuclease R